MYIKRECSGLNDFLFLFIQWPHHLNAIGLWKETKRGNRCGRSSLYFFFSYCGPWNVQGLGPQREKESRYATKTGSISLSILFIILAISYFCVCENMKRKKRKLRTVQRIVNVSETSSTFTHSHILQRTVRRVRTSVSMRKSLRRSNAAASGSHVVWCVAYEVGDRRQIKRKKETAGQTSSTLAKFLFFHLFICSHCEPQ